MQRKKRAKSLRPPGIRSVLFFIGLLFVILLASAFITNILIAKKLCANSESCIKNLSGIPEADNKGVFMGKTVFSPSHDLAKKTTNVLGEATEPTSGKKHIFVDLATQHLYAAEGGQIVFDFPISSGKWGRTPTGDFKIWIKLRSTRMTGGNQAFGTYYNLPNVPYTMYFYNDQVPASIGYGLHGAYWHDNFGHPMSHGCVNISPDNAGKLYDWAEPFSETYTTHATAANPGTPITIYGEAPYE